MAQRKGTMAGAKKELEPEEVEKEEVEVSDYDPEQESDLLEEDEEYDSYKMDPEEELWPGGPVFRQINEWKEQFGDIYVTSITPKDHVVWRTITRFEYRRLMQNTDQMLSGNSVSESLANLDVEDSIAEMCIVYPPYKRTDSTSKLGGLASTISQQVMEASGFSALEVRQL